MISQLALFSLTITLVCYELAEALFRWSGRRAVFNPLLWAVALIVPCLLLRGIEYRDYFAGVQLLHFLLGPATIALAVPLYEQRQRVRAVLVPLAGATLAAAVTSLVVTLGMLLAAKAGKSLIASLAPRSVTTPVAMAVAEQFGGNPTLTASIVIITGVFGAITIPGVLAVTGRVLGPPSAAAEGLALGMSAHGAGVARAFQDGNETGAFAGLAIGLHAVAAAVLIPLAMKAIGIS
ncbi:LrgB family protein [Lacipirellula parvula]|uniref:LrgA-associated membrane protein LrgB n=1 Tax=Lacipirellula parvula TaxID=2650471 RepID=A0A5K7XKI3_9BACT|nr:LrgB family protein [Lacipirellula parvula]BBO34793.1 lrgA-associated membrane protein LrgB [Lacipirellula parvula]